MSQTAKSVRTNSFGWMIQVLSARLDKEMTARLESLNLNLRQFAVMMTALEEEGLTQSQIGNRFSMSAHAISRAIDHLEQLDLVERREHETSRRAHKIFTTEQGRAIGPTLFSIVQEVNQDFLEPLLPEEIEGLGTALRKLVKAKSVSSRSL